MPIFAATFFESFFGGGFASWSHSGSRGGPGGPGGDRSYPFHPLLHTPRRRRVRLVRLGIYRRGRGRRVWRSERLFHPGTAPGGAERGGGGWFGGGGGSQNDRTRRQGNGQGRSDDELFEHLEQMRKEAARYAASTAEKRDAERRARQPSRSCSVRRWCPERTRASPSTCIAARIRRRRFRAIDAGSSVLRRSGASASSRCSRASRARRW